MAVLINNVLLILSTFGSNGFNYSLQSLYPYPFNSPHLGKKGVGDSYLRQSTVSGRSIDNRRMRVEGPERVDHSVLFTH